MARRRLGRRHAGILAVGAASAAALAVGGSFAYACTILMGPMTFNPGGGRPGTVIVTSASGLKSYPAKYALHFAINGNSDCMSFTDVTTLKTVRTDASGAWANVKVTIPKSAALGLHAFCGMETYPNAGETGTEHYVLSVT